MRMTNEESRRHVKRMVLATLVCVILTLAFAMTARVSAADPTACGSSEMDKEHCWIEREFAYADAADRRDHCISHVEWWDNTGVQICWSNYYAEAPIIELVFSVCWLFSA